MSNPQDRSDPTPSGPFARAREFLGRGEGRGAFGGFVGPANLLAQVAVGAPYLLDERCPRAVEVADFSPEERLLDLARAPLGWWRVLLGAERLPATPEPTARDVADYFALCLAAHFASAPSYVPTDVDAKVRGALWQDQTDPAERELMRQAVEGLSRWDLCGFCGRVVSVEAGDPQTSVSGLDGERLSVLAGALAADARLAEAGDGEARGWAQRFEELVDGELAREARLFDRLCAERGRELDAVRAAALLAHNAGDVAQGLGGGAPERLKARFGQLVQGQNGAADRRYGGAFQRAGVLYREIAAAEGHRNYPLRAAPALRSHPALLLPLGPFLDDFGELLARFEGGHPGGSSRVGFLPFGARERAEAVVALVEGVRRVPGQRGYQRALAGFEAAHPGGFTGPELQRHLPGSVRKVLEKGPLRKEIDLPRRSFESASAKRVRSLLG